MRRHLQQIRSELVIGWLLAIGGTLVYLLTLEPTVSFWDSGEFIAVSHRLQVGHPPGAPLYQLLAHAFSWMAGNDVTAVARCCNALSAVAGGLTVMFLYWSILLLFRTRKKRTPDTPGTSYSLHLPAAVGALCYLFCDTAWFSAVESEVYSLAMLIASVTLWAMLRWYHSTDYRHSFRWLLLIALLLGMGICVHLLTLLTTPTLLILMLFKLRDVKKTSDVPFFQTAFPLLKPQFPLLLVFFFIIGLSPYSIIPIRAAANTPINEMGPATAEQFKQYFTREQYEKAPLYPRMWRHHKNDAQYAASWSGGDTTWVGNMSYYFSYQFTYMYLRYLMWNFSGRYNDRQGYGSPQNGQFLTGLPPLDRLLVGTSKRPPDSLPNKGHNIYYLLPLLLGLAGAVVLTDNRKPFWTIMSLFLMGGIILSVYLNHPTYEPRERDYAYILSFYAFCMAIGFGAEWITRSVNRLFSRSHRVPRLGLVLATLLLGIPLLMACQNWDDHDRSHRYIAYDSGKNILNSCDTHPDGTVLFCYGDNDTFPLWYLQSVENTRPDIRVENIGIMGWKNFISLLTECIKNHRPVYFTHYAYDQYHTSFEGRLQLEGNAYRLTDHPCDSVAVEPFLRHIMNHMTWHSLEGVYIDEVGCRFLEQYWNDAVLLAENLINYSQPESALKVLDKTLLEIPLYHIHDVRLIYRVGQAYNLAGDTIHGQQIHIHLRHILKEQLDYYHTLPPSLQDVMPYTLNPRTELYALLSTQ